MSNMPLVAGVEVERRLFRYQGVTVWSVTRGPSLMQGSSRLLTFAPRAPLWARVFAASSEIATVRPMVDASGKVVLLYINAEGDSTTDAAITSALKNVRSLEQRFYFGKGWLNHQSHRATVIRRLPARQLFSLYSVSAVVAIAGVATLALVLGRNDVALDSARLKSTARTATVKPAKPISDTGLTLKSAVVATRHCVKQQTAAPKSASFNLDLVVDCLEKQGHPIKASKTLAMGGVAKISINFSEQNISVASKITRHGAVWSLDSED